VRNLALPDNHRQLLQRVYRTPGGERRRRRLNNYALEAISFPVMYFHNIHSTQFDSSGDLKGYLSDAQLQAQFDRLNAAFSPFISFGSWERRDYGNDNLFENACSPHRMAQFQQSNAVTGALNTYFTNCLDQSNAKWGWAYLPTSFNEDDHRHGAVADYRSIDDSSRMSGGTQGNTAVHEWGHAFGLLHTFEGYEFSEECDCTWGDLVDDTPPENGPHTGGGSSGDNCRARNSCVELGDEDDPIRNYMDYSDDVCMSEFTPGQFERMLYILAVTKQNLISASLNDADERACIVGTYYDESQGKCVTCGEGTYQDEPGQASCKSCPPDAASVSIIGNPSNSRNVGIGGLRTHKEQCYNMLSVGCDEASYGDNYCDEGNNRAECYFDGGDCCEACCDGGAGDSAGDEAVDEAEAAADFPDSYSCGAGDSGYNHFAQCYDPTCEDSVVPDANEADGEDLWECYVFEIDGTSHPTVVPGTAGSPTAVPPSDDDNDESGVQITKRRVIGFLFLALAASIVIVTAYSCLKPRRKSEVVDAQAIVVA